MDREQKDHKDFLDALTTARGPRIISSLVVAELDYMILREYGREAQLAFLDEVDRGVYWLDGFGVQDFTRAFALMQHYSYLTSFGIADASNVVLAERYGTTDILTTDQRDFRQVTTASGEHFRILPYDLEAGGR
jgi:predicted nucleic acid-binding protein